MNFRLLSIGVMILLSVVLCDAPAIAHSQFERSSPAAGSTVPTPPREVAIWFSRDIEIAYSRIEVRNVDGVAVHEGKSVRDPANRRKLSVPLKTLPPGTYWVFWRVLSVDTHKRNGSFSFKVAR